MTQAAIPNGKTVFYLHPKALAHMSETGPLVFECCYEVAKDQASGQFGATSCGFVRAGQSATEQGAVENLRSVLRATLAAYRDRGKIESVFSGADWHQDLAVEESFTNAYLARRRVVEKQGHLLSIVVDPPKRK